MYLRLRDGVSIGTFTYVGSSEEHYFVENEHEEFEISCQVYQELMRADGTHALRLSKGLLRQMKRDGILTTSRYIHDGIISRYLLFPLGESIARFQPVCRVMNALLPILAGILLVASIFVRRKYGHPGIGELNFMLYYLLLFLSVAAHECGHLVSGIAYGYRFTEIGLLLFGILPAGAYVAHYKKEESSRLACIQHSLAGVEVNLLITALFLLLSVIPSPMDETLVMVANINVLLAVFNLLPTFGMDGEDALSALLGLESISRYTKLYLKNRAFRKDLSRMGAARYACIAVFAVNLLSSVLAGLLIVCDVVASIKFLL